EREPDWAALLPGTPHVVRRLLNRCLDKDLKTRLRDIGDARSDLGEAQNPGVTEGQGQARINDVRQPLVMLSAVLVLAWFLGWAWAHRTRPSIEATTVRLQVSPPDGTKFVTDSDSPLSPDGTQMAFVAARSGQTTLWVRSLKSVDGTELPGTEG